MATHDYVLANAAGAAFRADLNDALEAIVSQNSNATEPTTTYAYMPWFDTTNGILKFRNASNTGWVVDDLNSARGSVTMHATTMDLWAEPKIIDGTGSSVTITDIVDAPQAGAVRILYPVAGTVITNNATFDVDGNANYTTAAGDALIFEAVTISTFKVHIIKADGTAVVSSASLPSQTGNSGKVLKTNGTSASWGRAGVMFSEVATTSGSSADFSSIPTDIDKITVVFSGVSTNGTQNFEIRIGPAAGVEASGYDSSADYGGTVVGSSTGFIIRNSGAANAHYGSFQLFRVSGNKWSASGVIRPGASGGGSGGNAGGSKTTAAAVEKLSVITSDTFDAGSVTIYCE